MIVVLDSYRYELSDGTKLLFGENALTTEELLDVLIHRAKCHQKVSDDPITGVLLTDLLRARMRAQEREQRKTVANRAKVTK